MTDAALTIQPRTLGENPAQALLDKLIAGEEVTLKDQMAALVQASADWDHFGQYWAQGTEAVLALACEMYDFHPDENQPREVSEMDDHEIIIEALRRLRGRE
jgi:hypothetical protein